VTFMLWRRVPVSEKTCFNLTFKNDDDDENNATFWRGGGFGCLKKDDLVKNT
jgi:hypothetical protein